jgi:multicomponent Na+:H+ antiporter subunit E
MRFLDVVARAALLAGWWWILTRGDGRSWLVGAPVVLAATLLSGALSPRIAWRWSGAGALRFAGFFLLHSFLGGVDVARRAFHPRLPLRPGFVTLHLRLPPGAGRVWLAMVVSLLPGTVSAELEGDRLVVHAVDTRAPVARSLRAAEMRLADMLRLDLRPETEAQP